MFRSDEQIQKCLKISFHVLTMNVNKSSICEFATQCNNEKDFVEKKRVGGENY